MFDKLERVVSKIIIPHYPKLKEFVVRDLFDNMDFDYLKNRNYVVEFITSECLDSNEMMKIDSEVKSLFQMLRPEKPKGGLEWDDREPSVSCYFDCEDGEGYVFNGEYGYEH
jgi:hypothetical protein